MDMQQTLYQFWLSAWPSLQTHITAWVMTHLHSRIPPSGWQMINSFLNIYLCFGCGRCRSITRACRDTKVASPALSQKWGGYQGMKESVRSQRWNRFLRLPARYCWQRPHAMIRHARVCSMEIYKSAWTGFSLGRSGFSTSVNGCWAVDAGFFGEAVSNFSGVDEGSVSARSGIVW